MRSAAILLLLSALATLPSPPRTAAAEVTVPPGTTIPTKLKRGLDLKKARVGDTVTCEVLTDVKVSGAVAIPRKAKVLATIWELPAVADKHKQSPYVVKLEATRAEWPGGSATLK